MNPGEWNWKAIFTVLAFSALIYILLASNIWLKSPLPGEFGVKGVLSELNTIVNETNPSWEQAAILGEQLRATWPEVKGRLKYNGEKDDIMRFERALAILLGAIEIQDRVGAREQIAVLTSLWHDL